MGENFQIEESKCYYIHTFCGIIGLTSIHSDKFTNFETVIVKLLTLATLYDDIFDGVNIASTFTVYSPPSPILILSLLNDSKN